MSKIRLDINLVNKGLFDSREKARRAIMEGIVFVNGTREDKAGFQVCDDAEIEIKGNRLPYVSRGGLKLEKAIKEFNIDLSDKICLDIGASTGGFTDCMLQNGAKKVYSVDVGYGQLAWKLRSDDRVVVMERTNFRHVSPEDIGEMVGFASADVSFISLDKIIPPAKKILKPDADMVCLIKPQFEAGREKIGKKGVVKDEAVHQEVIERIIKLAHELEFSIKGLSYSPIKGPKGNIEYLLYIGQGKKNQSNFSIEETVKLAHNSL